MQRHSFGLVAFSLVIAQPVFLIPVEAQQKSCTQIAANARNWLVRNPGSQAYNDYDVDRALKECLKSGYWKNVSKGGGQPAKKQ